MLQQIDKPRVRHSFSKSLYTYNQHAEVQARMAEIMIRGLQSLGKTRFNRVFEIGCGTGLLTARFFKSCQASTFHANDLVEECRFITSDILGQYPQIQSSFIGGDIEHIAELPEELDLILSNATFQWLEDFNGFLPKMKSLLNERGLLAFSTFGPDNLREIKQLTGNTLEYLTVERLTSLLQEHFHIHVCSEEFVTLNFSSPREVLRHLRLTGVNGNSRLKWTKSSVVEFEQQYQSMFGEEKHVPLTYHPIYCIVEK